MRSFLLTLFASLASTGLLCLPIDPPRNTFPDACAGAGDLTASILPSQPTSANQVTIRVTGSWCSGCVPNRAQLSLQGNELQVTVDQDYTAGIACTAEAVPSWTVLTTAGPLPPGEYTLRATVKGTTGDFTASPVDFTVTAASPQAPALSASDACPGADSLEAIVYPLNPTSGDRISLTVRGAWCDSCVPNEANLLMTSENELQMTVFQNQPGGCLDVIVPSWSVTRIIGPLPPGTYHLKASVVGTIANDTAAPVSFTVTSGSASLSSGDCLPGRNLAAGLEPAQPASADTITLTMTGCWRDGCVPNQAAVLVSETQLEMTARRDYPELNCTQAIVPFWSLSKTAGPLAPGEYEVRPAFRDVTTSIFGPELRFTVAP